MSSSPGVLKKNLSGELSRALASLKIENKKELLQKATESLEELYGKSKGKALSFYKEYLELKRNVVSQNLLNNSALKNEISNLLTECYKLSNAEISGAQGVFGGIFQKSIQGFNVAIGSSEKRNFKSDVLDTIQSFFGVVNRPNLLKNKSGDKINNLVKELYNNFQSLRESLKNYASYTVDKIGEKSAINFEAMPAVCVFVRILLGLAGVEKDGKAKGDKLNRKFKYNKFDFGSGIIGCLAYNTVVALYESLNEVDFKVIEDYTDNDGYVINNTKILRDYHK